MNAVFIRTLEAFEKEKEKRKGADVCIGKQTHMTPESPALMAQLYDAQFANIASYDCCVQIVIPSIECFVRMKADPYFKQTVGPDHEKFADTRKSQMMVGWFTPLMKDGQIVREVAVNGEGGEENLG